MASKEVKLVTIVGPTASGKTELAVRVAKRFNGEIICADSRTIYKGMDIGTAKPPLEEREDVPHWGLDLVEPGEQFSAAQFKDYALTKVAEIEGRGRLPIMVGGSGLYVDGVLYDFQFVEANKDPSLDALGIERLQKLILERGLDLPVNSKNRRHLVRTLERSGRIGGKKPLREGTFLIGLMPSDEALKFSINQRAERIFNSGVVGETESLLKKFGQGSLDASGGIVYKICTRLLNGEIDEQAALDLFRTADWQYARRQKTWFKRNHDIVWFKSGQEAFVHLSRLLNN